jgi:hypothetical protein
LSETYRQPDGTWQAEFAHRFFVNIVQADEEGIPIRNEFGEIQIDSMEVMEMLPIEYIHPERHRVYRITNANNNLRRDTTYYGTFRWGTEGLWARYPVIWWETYFVVHGTYRDRAGFWHEQGYTPHGTIFQIIEAHDRSQVWTGEWLQDHETNEWYFEERYMWPDINEYEIDYEFIPWRLRGTDPRNPDGSRIERIAIDWEEIWANRGWYYTHGGTIISHVTSGVIWDPIVGRVIHDANMINQDNPVLVTTGFNPVLRPHIPPHLDRPSEPDEEPVVRPIYTYTSNGWTVTVSAFDVNSLGHLHLEFTALHPDNAPFLSFLESSDLFYEDGTNWNRAANFIEEDIVPINNGFRYRLIASRSHHMDMYFEMPGRRIPQDALFERILRDYVAELDRSRLGWPFDEDGFWEGTDEELKAYYTTVVENPIIQDLVRYLPDEMEGTREIKIVRLGSLERVMQIGYPYMVTLLDSSLSHARFEVALWNPDAIDRRVLVDMNGLRQPIELNDDNTFTLDFGTLFGAEPIQVNGSDENGDNGDDDDEDDDADNPSDDGDLGLVDIGESVVVNGPEWIIIEINHTYWRLTK